MKHHSEWLRDSLSELWRMALAEQAEAHPELALYNKQFIDALVWMKDVPEINSGEALWHMHPVVFLSCLNNIPCDCESLYADKFKVTRYGTQFGPVYWGEISLAMYSGWNRLINNGLLTSDEKNILIAMSENEGKLDAIQSYDSEVITAGAMQKTVKNSVGYEGKGELSVQLAKFRDKFSGLYQQYAVNCGWSVEGSGSNAVIYYTDVILTNGQKITSTVLKKLVRQGCNEQTYRTVIHNKPLAALLKVITLPEYLELQVIDFVDRLHNAEATIVSSSGKKISDYIKSNFGRAVVLDHSVNRPGYVRPDFKLALDNFHRNNPGVNLDPTTWGDSHAANERNLLNEYKSTRRMTNSVLRFNELRAKL